MLSNEKPAEDIQRNLLILFCRRIFNFGYTVIVGGARRMPPSNWERQKIRSLFQHSVAGKDFSLRGAAAHYGKMPRSLYTLSREERATI